MSALAWFNHLLNFLAPALCLALGLTAASRFFVKKWPNNLGWIAQLATLFGASAVVLAIGLLGFGRDGKMLTYAALVVVLATVQTLMLRR